MDKKLRLYEFPGMKTSTINQGYEQVKIIHGLADIDEANPTHIDIVKRFGAIPSIEKVKPTPIIKKFTKKADKVGK